MAAGMSPVGDAVSQSARSGGVLLRSLERPGGPRGHHVHPEHLGHPDGYVTVQFPAMCWLTSPAVTVGPHGAPKSDK